MKLLLDFLPIILFFATFKYAGSHVDWATAFANEHVGFLVSGGVIGPVEAPVMLATLVVIVATLTQIAITLARGRRVDTMLWVSFGIIVVLGAATVWFHNETFIKWKPTAVHWAMALALLLSQLVFRKNLIRSMMGEHITLDPEVWQRLNAAWIAFFAAMGALNLYVAYSYSTDVWVNFKLFGGLGLVLLFMLGSGVYLSRHLRPDGDAGDTAAQSVPAKLPS